MQQGVKKMDEQLKQPLLVGVLIANIVFIAYQFLFNMNPFSYSLAFLGLVIGVALGGAAFAAMYFLRKE